ncbi:hypothetical protein GQ457_11G032380 [Hibiscus cannabinus]
MEKQMIALTWPLNENALTKLRTDAVVGRIAMAINHTPLFDGVFFNAFEISLTEELMIVQAYVILPYVYLCESVVMRDSTTIGLEDDLTIVISVKLIRVSDRDKGRDKAWRFDLYQKLAMSTSRKEEGEAKLQRKAEVRNYSVFSNNNKVVSMTTKWETFDSRMGSSIVAPHMPSSTKAT